MGGCLHPFEIPSRWVRDEVYAIRKRLAGAAYDYQLHNLVVDGAWHTLSFASVVPPKAQAMNLHQKLAANPVTGSSTIYLRPAVGDAMVATCTIRPQINLLDNGGQTVIGLNAAREIEYRILPGGNLTVCNLTVKGWWI